MITSAGLMLFLIAGAFTFVIMPSDKPQPEKVIPRQEIPEPEKISAWYVYVTGAVINPGVYKISQDSRIFHAINAAGGFTSRADQTALNLAEALTDGSHVHVSQKDELDNPTAPARIPGVLANNTSLVDVNHASVEELTRLKGVGPAISKRIVDYRKAHGKFRSVDELINVRGIGPAKLEQIRPQIIIR